LAAKVLMLLADEYRPDPRVRKEALALMEAGLDVTVIEWDRSRSRSAREVEGVRVIGVRTGRVGGLTSLLLRFPVFWLRLFMRGLRSPAQVVHAHDLDTLLPAVLVSRFRGLPLIYDAHEHYAAMVAGDLPGFMTRMLDRLEAWLVRRAHLVISVNQKIEEHLRPNVRGDSVIVMNCIDLLERRPPHEGRELTLIYSGSLDPSRYVMEVAEAIHETEGTQLMVAGKGPLRDRLERLAVDTDRIEFVGYLPHPRLLELTREAEVVLCLLDPSNGNNRIGTPNKLFESMVLGVPILVSKGTHSAEIVEQEGCGLSIDWGEREFFQALEELRDPEVRERMARSGRKAAEARYNWEIMGESLVRAYGRLLASSSVPGE